ncbi:MAG: HAMP domain-containing sensor histidine kinase [Chloroflexota bacterium]
MTDEQNRVHAERYASLLKRFTSSEDPAAVLEAAAALSQDFLADGIAPLEIQRIHDAAIAEGVDPADAPALVAAHRLLLEVLFAYAAAYSSLSEKLLADADAEQQAVMEVAERAEQNRLALLAGVSHELGSPLMIVKGNVASIRKFLEERGSWPDDLNEREADVEFAIDRMMSLREELLAASRDETRELEIVELPLPGVVRRVIRWGQAAAAEKSIQLIEDSAPDLPFVVADEVALQSILTNLLSNAIRYTEAEGTVTVTARHEGDIVAIEVADTGIGISEEDQLRIYERFYRTVEGKKAVAFGIGLGLAITRDQVSSLAGTIEVRSQVGVGSTFRVTLPAGSTRKKDA